MDEGNPRADLAALARARGCELVALRFTDLLGRWLAISAWTRGLAPGAATLSCASSNVAGWGGLQGSDLAVRADPATALVDPFAARPTLLVLGEALDASGLRASPMDPRATLARAMERLRASGVADELRVGVELEFYLFDDVRFRVAADECSFRVEERDSLENAARARPGGNRGHRVGYASQHLAGAPLDVDAGWRAELLAMADRLGLEPLGHQHEAGPGQHEIALGHAPALRAADRIQLGKWMVLNAAAAAGRSATFMPKPLPYKPGSGMHLNVSLWRGGAPLFAAPGGGEALMRGFVGGVFAHMRALGAIANPGTNSFRRLAQLQAPGTPLAWGEANRAAAIRVPRAGAPEALRLELRFPDAAANPYLAIAAIAMAGLDGILRGLDPGPRRDDDPRRAAGAAWDVRRRAPDGPAFDLAEAILALDADRGFLEEGGVFDGALVEALVLELNRQLRVCRALPHPNEYYMYFSA